MSAETPDLDPPAFELPNAGAGPDPLSLSALAGDDAVDVVVLLFQRDHYCGNCRRQVRAVADRYGEFESLGAEVVSVLPEPRERAESWQSSYDLPFPLLADPATEVSDGYGQPVRFGVLGRLHDLVGRMPETVVLDVRGADAETVHVHRGDSPSDRPDVPELLDLVGAVVE